MSNKTDNSKLSMEIWAELALAETTSHRRGTLKRDSHLAVLKSRNKRSHELSSSRISSACIIYDLNTSKYEAKRPPVKTAVEVTMGLVSDDRQLPKASRKVSNHKAGKRSPYEIPFWGGLGKRWGRASPFNHHDQNFYWH
jgi:hypothetical protein